jgi:hypothetical protein
MQEEPTLIGLKHYVLHPARLPYLGTNDLSYFDNVISDQGKKFFALFCKLRPGVVYSSHNQASAQAPCHST